MNGNYWFWYRYALTFGIGIGTRSKGTEIAEISISAEIYVSVVHYFSADQNSLFSSTQ